MAGAHAFRRQRRRADGRRLGQARDRPPRRRARLGRHGARDAGARHRRHRRQGRRPRRRAARRDHGRQAHRRPDPALPPARAHQGRRRPRPRPRAGRVEIEATVATTGPTGVEMEALTAVSVAALTVYDMLKAVDRGMVIGEIRLALKEGGKSGRFEAPLMALLPVAEAHAPADAPLRAARAPRRCRSPRRRPRARPRRRRRPAAAALPRLGDGRLRASAPPTPRPAPGCRPIGASAAGARFAGAVGPGEAVRIFTGAPVPAGADLVVIQEDVERRRRRITLARGPRRATATSARPAATSPAGARVAAPRRLRPVDLALLAAMNAARVAVHAPPGGRADPDRRRARHARRGAGARPDRLLERLRAQGDARGRRRRGAAPADRPRHRREPRRRLRRSPRAPT